MPLFKRKRNTKFYFFSGKGGVGKTSTAAATALWFAKKGKKVLIISTDPAHSLSDSFDIKIGGEIKKIAKNLFAVEIDPEIALHEYKAKLMPKIEKIEYLKDLGIGGFFDVDGAPGIDEVAAFDKFLQFMQSRDYDIIIFDTAPTGHALRFLSLPEMLDSWLGKLIKMRLKITGFVNLFKKFLPFTEPDEQIDTGYLDVMRERVKLARSILTDPEKTSYYVVLIPEKMAIAETQRYLKMLKSYEIPIKSLIVNQVLKENSGCKFCNAKYKQQTKRIKEIESFGLPLLIVPAFEREVRGLKVLEKFANALWSRQRA